ncbi:MAG TPA: LemA family protein [Symbiobacteriaceae bacterium]|nr:LemA family protein [Symbiobacteriaceae bacterium]
MTAVLIGAVVVVVLIIVLMYNSLIGKRNQVDSVFSTIDVMLKKRYDLIPNLVESVKGYMSHERETLERIAQLRTQGLNSRTDAEKVAVDNQIAGPLRQLLVAVEAYPDLKANQNFLHLQGSLNEVEEQISAARRAYNAAVLQYNNAVQMFPTSMIAGMMHLQTRTFFEAQPEERQAVKVSFSSGGVR